MADLQRKLANLFDESAGVKGYYINASGEEVASSSSEYEFAHTQKILVEPETPYTYSLTVKRLGVYRRIIGYDENKNYIRQIAEFNISYSTGFKYITFTTPKNCHYITINYIDDTFASEADLNMMLNTGTSALPYEPYGWVHSLRKLTTATETIQSGDTIYANGQPITAYTIKGNTVQNSTPTPSNPVAVNGVGEETVNLFPVSSFTGKSYTVMNNFNSASETIEFLPNTQYTISLDFSSTLQTGIFKITFVYTDETSSSSDWLYGTTHRTLTSNVGKTVSSISLTDYAQYVDVTISDIMLNAGSTALPYEPYGYNIPISNGQGSAVNYLGSVQSNRQIQKLVLTGQENWYIYEAASSIPYPTYQFYTIGLNMGGKTGLSAYCTIAPYGLTTSTRQNGEYGAYMVSSGADIGLQMYGSKSQFPDVTAWETYLQQQYAAGTPVTVWYVLATPETGIVNEPLMKIGDYADSISNATSIPTTDGANSITVDTTVQPSEFTATWTGWHDAYVKEKSENLFDKAQTSLIYNAYLTSDGTWLWDGSSRTVKLLCDGNTQYTISIGVTSPIFRISEYNDSTITPSSSASSSAILNSIVRGENMDEYTFTTAADTKCLIFQASYAIYDSWINSLMFNEGQTALPYEPYWK